jgi:hypothetical protein
MLLHQTAAAAKYLMRCRALHQLLLLLLLYHQKLLQVLRVLWELMWVLEQQQTLQPHCCTCLLALAHPSIRQQGCLRSNTQQAG